MPWVLPNATYAVRWVNVLIVAYGYCWAVTNELFNVYFLCNIFRASKDIILFISDGVEG